MPHLLLFRTYVLPILSSLCQLLKVGKYWTFVISDADRTFEKPVEMKKKRMKKLRKE